MKEYFEQPHKYYEPKKAELDLAEEEEKKVLTEKVLADDDARIQRLMEQQELTGRLEQTKRIGELDEDVVPIGDEGEDFFIEEITGELNGKKVRALQFNKGNERAREEWRRTEIEIDGTLLRGVSSLEIPGPQVIYSKLKAIAHFKDQDAIDDAIEDEKFRRSRQYEAHVASERKRYEELENLVDKVVALDPYRATRKN